jgi:hypothetical protein
MQTRSRVNDGELEVGTEGNGGAALGVVVAVSLGKRAT